MEIFLFFWLGAIVLCIVIANSNGRSAILAGLMGFLFGWIAVILYALIGESVERKIERAKLK